MSMIPELGTLEEVDLSLAWTHEALGFTPWLAEHLDVLAGVIGIPLELEGVEVNVGSFWADILARTRNQDDDSLVLIENQLKMSDHDHLGKIMTYLAGLEAKVIIWIARDFRTEHLSAIRWLNDHTAEPFSFLAVRVKVVRIGGSPLAPIFEVLEKPNKWERQLQEIAKETQALTPEGQFLRAFWTRYLEMYPEEEEYGKPGSYSRWRKVLNEFVIASSIGKGKVSIYIRGDFSVPIEDIFAKLEPHEAIITEKIKAPIRGPKRDRLFECELVVDTKDETRWDELATWLHETANAYELALREIMIIDIGTVS